MIELRFLKSETACRLRGFKVRDGKTDLKELWGR